MTLIAMSGLPGSGKSTIAKTLAAEIGCVILSVDTIEHELREAGVEQGQPIGLAAYSVASLLADVQLGLGLTVIVDAVNQHPDARQTWLDLAAKHCTPLRVIEVECSDLVLHRARLESREHDLPALSWSCVQELRSEWTPWTVTTEIVDTVLVPK